MEKVTFSENAGMIAFQRAIAILNSATSWRARRAAQGG
jgi:hypothetical protein